MLAEEANRRVSELAAADSPTAPSPDLVPAEAPIAVVPLPLRVPHGFHGSWIPDPR